MRKVTASCLALGLAACAAGHRSVATAGVETLVVGRIVSTQEVSSFIGDVEGVWYSHLFAPNDAPDARFTILADREGCPRAGDRDTVYRMSLRPRREPIWLRQGQTAELVSDWVVSSCEPIGP